MYDESAAHEIAEHLLKRSPADQTEVVLWAENSQLTRFANNTIHQHVAEEDAQVTVRAVFGQRVGVASGNQLDPNSLDEVVDRAAAIARVQPENPDFESLPAPEIWERTDAYRESTAICTPQRRAEAVAAITDAAAVAGLQAAGAFSTEAVTLAVANSLGTFTYHPFTVADLHAVAMEDGASGYATTASTDVDALDAGTVATEAVDRAVRSRHPRAIEPGEYEVVLEPPAVAELLDYTAYAGLSGLSVLEERSFLNELQGQRALDPKLSIWDDGHDRSGIPIPFDFEGVPKRRVLFVDRGTLREAVYDSVTGRRAGVRSTGHALPAPNTYGPLPMHLVMGAGDHTRDEMIADIKRGLWITRFWYVNIVHPLSVTLTGTTRDGTFLIENGEVVGPVENLRFTQSVLEAFKEVPMIGRDRQFIRGWFGGAVVPPLRLARFTFSGGSAEGSG
jgi:predicted Zn-dependent protease